MNALEWITVWLLATVVAAAAGTLLATGAAKAKAPFTSMRDARNVPGMTRRPDPVRCALDTNRNPADAIPNGGRRTAWVETPEVPRNDYQYCIGA